MYGTSLILGAGLVVRPLVEYLSRRPDNRLTIASHIVAAAAAARVDNASALVLDVTDTGALSRVVAKHDVVISLVPPFCIRELPKSASPQKYLWSMPATNRKN